MSWFRSQNIPYVSPVILNEKFAVATIDGMLHIIDAVAESLITSVSLSVTGYSIAVGNGKIAVGGYSSVGQVEIFDATTYASIAVINSVGSYVLGMTYGNGYFYAAASGSNEVYVIDATTNTITTSFSSPSPFGIAFGNNVIGVTQYQNIASYNIYDSTSYTLLSNSGAMSYGSATGFGDNKFIVSDDLGNKAVLIDAATYSVLAMPTVGANPYGTHTGYGNGYFATTNYPVGTVSIIQSSTNSVVSTVSVGGNPLDSEYASGKFGVTDYTGYLHFIDATSFAVLSTLTLSFGAWGIVKI